MSRRLFASLLFITACEAGTLGLEELGDAKRDGGHEGCMQLEPTIRTGLIDAVVQQPSSPTVEITGGSLYTTRVRDNFSAQVVAFDPRRDLEVSITDPEEVGYLVDASDGASLFVAGAAIDRLSLFHRDEAGQVRAVGINEAVGWFDEAYYGRDLELVDRSGAVWRNNDGIWRWDTEGRAPSQLATAAGFPNQPSRNGGRVVWTGSGPESARILLHDSSGIEPRTIATGDLAWPALSGSYLFYVDAGRLVRLDLDTSEQKTLHEGPCGPPFADGDRAVAACGGEGGFVAPGAFIAYWDGVQTHELFRDGGHHHAPRLDRGRIAWIRYLSAEVLCMPSRDGSGEVRWWDPDVSAEPIVLGAVDAPCLCCNAFWPASVVAFEDDLVAWNYAIKSETERGFVGWAVIERREVCSPN